MSLQSRVSALFRPAFLIKALPLVVAVACSAVLTFAFNAAIRQGHSMVEHSLTALAAMDRVLSVLQDAETGQRGYVITGDRAYLAPYEKAQATLAGAIAALDALVGRNSEQHEAVTQLQATASRKMDELAATIALRSGSGFDAARGAIARDDGRAEMDRIRELVQAMQARERAILDDASEQVTAKNQKILFVSLAALGISLLGRLASAVVTLRGRFRSRHG